MRRKERCKYRPNDCIHCHHFVMSLTERFLAWNSVDVESKEGRWWRCLSSIHSGKTGSKLLPVIASFWRDTKSIHCDVQFLFLSFSYVTTEGRLESGVWSSETSLFSTIFHSFADTAWLTHKRDRCSSSLVVDVAEGTEYQETEGEGGGLVEGVPSRKICDHRSRFP